MSLRSACFVGAVSAGVAGAPTWVWPVLIAGAIILPYIAVVLANIQTTRSDGFALLDTTRAPRARTAGATPRPERLRAGASITRAMFPVLSVVPDGFPRGRPAPLPRLPRPSR